MAYSAELEQCIDRLLIEWQNIEKKKMFGGVCYLLAGNICFGIWQNNVIVRTDVANAANQLLREHVRPFDVTGRPMKGWLLIAAAGCADDATLYSWLLMGQQFAATLPEK